MITINRLEAVGCQSGMFNHMQRLTTYAGRVHCAIFQMHHGLAVLITRYGNFDRYQLIRILLTFQVARF